MNMSYCRFENTAADLEDCREALESPEDTGPLSRTERSNAVRLLRTVLDLANMMQDRLGMDADDLLDDDDAAEGYVNDWMLEAQNRDEDDDE